MSIKTHRFFFVKYLSFLKISFIVYISAKKVTTGIIYPGKLRREQMRKYDVLGSQLVSIIFLEEKDYEFIIYKEYSDTKNVLMYYSIVGDEFDKNPYWTHVPMFAIKFPSYEEAKKIALSMGAKVGIYHEEKKY